MLIRRNTAHAEATLSFGHSPCTTAFELKTAENISPERQSGI